MPIAGTGVATAIAIAVGVTHSRFRLRKKTKEDNGSRQNAPETLGQGLRIKYKKGHTVNAKGNAFRTIGHKL